ncbi:MAG: hypothetical protein IT371_27290 [Deltaproteobacteria bacterium]|nr:hypothetical protein [Deltaproteobacteria bacterium]
MRRGHRTLIVSGLMVASLAACGGEELSPDGARQASGAASTSCDVAVDSLSVLITGGEKRWAASRAPIYYYDATKGPALQTTKALYGEELCVDRKTTTIQGAKYRLAAYHRLEFGESSVYLAEADLGKGYRLGARPTCRRGNVLGCTPGQSEPSETCPGDNIGIKDGLPAYTLWPNVNLRETAGTDGSVLAALATAPTPVCLDRLWLNTYETPRDGHVWAKTWLDTPNKDGSTSEGTYPRGGRAFVALDLIGIGELPARRAEVSAVTKPTYDARFLVDLGSSNELFDLEVRYSDQCGELSRFHNPRSSGRRLFATAKRSSFVELDVGVPTNTLWCSQLVRHVWVNVRAGSTLLGQVYGKLWWEGSAVQFAFYGGGGLTDAVFATGRTVDSRLGN